MKTIRYLYPEGRIKALTFSYDDGVVEDRRLVEIFNRHRLKGTFHLNAGQLDRGNRIAASEVKALYAGHEIACHSSTHPFLERIPPTSALEQVVEDRKRLEELAGEPVLGMSYPFGTWSAEVVAALRAAGIVYCRTTAATGRFNPPENWFEWHPTCHHGQDLAKVGQNFLANRYAFSLLYVWGHAYEFDRNNNWNLIEDFAAQAAGQEEVWYATNIEIHRYASALRRLEFTAVHDRVRNPSAMTVWIKVDETTVPVGPGELKTL